MNVADALLLATARTAPSVESAASNLRNAMQVIELAPLDFTQGQVRELSEALAAVRLRVSESLEQIEVGELRLSLDAKGLQLTDTVKDLLNRHGPKLFTAILDELDQVHRDCHRAEAECSRLRAKNAQLEEAWHAHR